MARKPPIAVEARSAPAPDLLAEAEPPFAEVLPPWTKPPTNVFEVVESVTIGMPVEPEPEPVVLVVLVLVEEEEEEEEADDFDDWEDWVEASF